MFSPLPSFSSVSLRRPHSPRTVLFAAACSSLFVLPLLSVPAAFAQQEGASPETATTAAVTPQERLGRIRADLTAVTPYLDAETRALLPTLQVIVERVAVDPDNATESDMAIYKLIRQAARQMKDTRGGGDEKFDPRAFLAATKSKIATASQANPQIAVKERKVPGGGSGGGHVKGAAQGRIGVVTLIINGQEKTIAEVPSAAGGLSPGDRARKIAQRIEAAKQANPLWYLSAHAAKTSSGSYVVAVDKAPGGYVLTADAEFAKLRQMTPEKLAARLATDIRSTVGKRVASRAATDTPEEKEATAVECRVKGDDAYDKGNVAEAEAQYKAGIAANANYVLLYERLAGLYDEAGKKSERDAIIVQALKLSVLTAEQKKNLLAFQTGG